MPPLLNSSPAENLKPDQLYEVRFNLAKVTSVSESKFKEFKFNIKTVKPSFVVKDYGLRSAAAKEQDVFKWRTGNSGH